MPVEGRKEFVDELVREHGQRLRLFLAARLRAAVAEVPDLMQEVYLRLLRVPSHESIRSPRAYLFTVALHVLHQHKLSRSTRPEAVDIADVLHELESRGGENPAVQIEVREELDAFDKILRELPQQTYTVFVLHRQYGYSREEIAQQLGLSVPMVKKLIASALVHCRLRIAGFE